MSTKDNTDHVKEVCILYLLFIMFLVQKVLIDPVPQNVTRLVDVGKSLSDYEECTLTFVGGSLIEMGKKLD